MPKLLKKVGWTMDDVDLIEFDEAFAAQVLADGHALADQGWDWNKVNVNSGAIALGHPLGASGARPDDASTLWTAVSKRHCQPCLGGGEAVAMAVELE
jgi:acetyl-CoA acetyltransferase